MRPIPYPDERGGGWLWRFAIGVCLGLLGCGATSSPAQTAVTPRLPDTANPQPQFAGWEPTGDDLSNVAPILRTTFNQVRLLIDPPEIFGAMEQMVADARHHIEMDYFIFGGKQGQRLAFHLGAKSRQGVHVDVTLDPAKGFTPELRKAANLLIATLSDAGVHVTGFPIDQLPRRQAINKVVDHDKVIVVDRRIAMVGGMNIADLFEKNHDVMLQIKGPAAADVGRFLAADRRLSLPLKVDAAVRPPTPISINPLRDAAPPLPAEMIPVRPIPTGINRQGYKDVLLDQIRRAAKSIHVLMFQLVDRDVVSALIGASRRGLEVRVILDPGDMAKLIPVFRRAPRGFPNLPVALAFQNAGVAVKWYRVAPDQMDMHAKLGIFDERTMLAGSTNWIPSAFHYNNEMSLAVEGGSAVARAVKMFKTDWAAHTDPVQDKGVTQEVLSWIIGHIPYL